MPEGNAKWQALEDDSDALTYAQRYPRPGRKHKPKRPGICYDCPNPSAPGRARCILHLRNGVKATQKCRL